ncbi:M15 family metallopeptidase [Fervidobacterium nodosum]|uniref:Cell wall biogenesis enzyme-like protein n=1 Tax=Fervidobacterium nodosum (strain ATCC 35602 / DSM 5306 / Rt17-B1) TaxID=381764 RepID=A7HJ25_FERNB|nr:M15 family metallopeptidase [Fervidobacterium nodosum]ABS59908.1 cell wall biogenesis enzyme-like protein [Fervidobacterium nodosum Rt17-B1]
MENNLEKLETSFKKLVYKFLSECQRQGIQVKIYNTLRTKEEQYALYLQGRAPLEVVNEARKRAKLKPITQSENKIVTYLKNSPHCYGLAFDFVPIINGKVVWNNDKIWEKCGKIAETFGLEWGGRWKNFPDKPHIQMKNWKKYIRI